LGRVREALNETFTQDEPCFVAMNTLFQSLDVTIFVCVDMGPTFGPLMDSDRHRFPRKTHP
jgi:hypothetical protein